MKIAHVSLEFAPLGGTTSAATAVADLLRAQSNSGEDVLMVCGVSLGSFLPPPYLARRLSPLVVESDEGTFDVVMMEGMLPGSHVRLFVLGLPDGAQGAWAFGKAVQSLMPTLGFVPELLHLHDDTGVPPDGLRERFDGVAVVQSVYDAATDSPSLVGAIGDADAVAVPCSGLWEADPELAVAQALAAHPSVRVVSGGLDVSHWNPAKDPALGANFSPEALAGKAVCRQALQQLAGLAPRTEPLLLCLWQRKAGEADSRVLLDLWDDIRGLDLQLVLLPPEGGSAQASLAKEWENRAAVWVAPNASETTIRTVLAGADAACLLQDRAPLGKRALIAMRYGLVPLARRVQAHRDLLVEYDAGSGTGGAFLYENGDELFRALHRLAETHGDADAWLSMVRANALVDSGWSRPLAHWNEIYRKTLAK